MTTGAHGNRPTKNQRREDARAQAKANRESQVKKEKRRRVFIQVGVIVGILAVVAVIGGVIVSNIPQAGPRPANMASDGIVLTAELDAKGNPTGNIVAVTNAALAPGAAPIATTPVAGKLNIVEYQDYQCPVCKNFDANDSEVIINRVKSGAATYEIHPIAFLNNQSQGTMYSTRSANAAACVANYEPNSFLGFNQILYTNQPEEGSTGLSDEQLISYADQATGTPNGSIADCITKQTFKGWVSEATKRVMDATTLPNSDVKFTGTPEVIVNGAYYDTSKRPGAFANGSFVPADFEAFLLEQAGKMVVPTAAPTPTPTPSKK